MPFKKDDTISFSIKEDGIREIIDEKNNSAIIMQEVSWNERGYHLEIRKWRIEETGEAPMKGFSFLTEEGPHNLTKALLKNGFGKTDEVLETIKDRKDFEKALIKTIGKKKVSKAKETEVEISEDDFFDPKEMFI